jgi:hypothetical protein
MNPYPEELLNPFFIENKLQDYLDEELSESDRAFVEEGLDRFPELQLKLEELIETRALLRKELLCEPPADLLNKIELAVQQEPQPKRDLSRPILFLVAAALLVVFMLPEEKQTWSNDLSSAQGIQAKPIDLPLLEEVVAIEPESATPPVEKSIPVLHKQKKATSKRARVGTLRSNPAEKSVEIYIPQDDQAAFDAADSYLNMQEAVQSNSKLQTEDSNLLYLLKEEANKINISIRTPSKKSFTPYPLSQERPFQLLQLEFAPEQFNSVSELMTKFGGSLRQPTTTQETGMMIAEVEVAYWHQY